MGDFESIGHSEWDPEFAADLIGCTLLVGLTYVDQDGTLIRREQVLGTVEGADESSGITLRLRSSGEPFDLAPLLEAIEPADPGVYQLSDGDEEVEDPDFLALMTVREPYRS